jgi:hypothetical protein
MSTSPASEGATLTPHELLGRLTERLTVRADMARRLAAAVAARQAENAQQLQQAMQPVGQELAALNGQLRSVARALAPTRLAELRSLTGEVAAADAAVGQQLAALGARNLDEWLLTQGRASAAVLDQLLAAPWDYEVDLVVLVGEQSTHLVRQLVERGQKRILTLDPGRPQSLVPEGSDPPAVGNYQDLEMLDAAASLIPFPHPGQARTLAVGPRVAVPLDDVVTRIRRTLRTLTEASNELDEAVPFFAQTAVRNLVNVSRLPSVDTLKGCLAGLPAVVVAAGPSLDKNIAQLRDLQGRVVVIGINQTVKALRQAGVRADMVIVVDPMKVGYHFEGVRPGELGTLFLGASVDPSLFALPADHIVTFAASPLAESWMYELMGENASSGSGGTVATAGIKLAAWLGCNPVISVGRDLALDGKRYYADASADGGQEVELTDGGQKISFASYSSKLRLAEGGDDTSVRQLLATQIYELHSVPGFFGTPVTTTNLFMYEMDLLKEVVHKLSAATTFINATEGGAFLQGMEHLTLAQALQRCPDRRVDVEAVVREKLATVDLQARRARLVSGVNALLVDLNSTVALARQAAAAAPAEASSPAQVHRRERLLDRTRKQLARASRSRLLMSMLVQRATRSIGRRQADKWSSLKEVEDAEQALYRAIEQTIGELARGIEERLPEIVAQLPADDRPAAGRATPQAEQEVTP